jgi:hypothetical protein
MQNGKSLKSRQDIAQVRLHRRIRGVRVVRGNRIDHCRMLLDEPVRSSRQGQRQDAKAIDRRLFTPYDTP